MMNFNITKQGNVAKLRAALNEEFAKIEANGDDVAALDAIHELVDDRLATMPGDGGASVNISVNVTGAAPQVGLVPGAGQQSFSMSANVYELPNYVG